MQAALEQILGYFPPDGEEQEIIKRAHAFAVRAHHGQKRRSGEPYVIHVEAAALLTAQWKLDCTTVVSALLHDTIEDTETTFEQLEREFGTDVAFIVNGVSKISMIKYRGNSAQAETLKKMILALSEDIRVVFVKLADRMHNMRTLEHLPREKAIRIAMETDELYVPLAYRLGLGSVSGELADLAFPYLHPEDYKALSHKLKHHLKNGEHYVAQVKAELSQMLTSNSIGFIRIDSRAKRISSLFKKLQKQDMSLDKIYDLVALRIIVQTVEDCYAAMGIIHAKWPPLPGHIKDYIALPKPNGYKSLHTTVICIDRKPTEIQIRTEAMHQENEYGVAAHWAYSEQKHTEQYKTGQAVFANTHSLDWINKLKQWQHEAEEPDDYLSSLRIDFFKDRIFVITPKGEAIDLPAGSTPVDFAYAIHSLVGDRCTGAKVNGRMVQLDHRLESGDMVEILTQKNKKPNPDWLHFVRTRQARNRIRAYIRERSGEPAKPFLLSLTVHDRVGVLNEITSIFTREKINIISIESTPPRPGSSLASIKATVGAEYGPRLEALSSRLQGTPAVHRVEYRRLA